MTFLSPIKSFAASQSDNKGSTYGKQTICWSNSYSFQRSQRSNRFNNSYRVEVLSGQAAVFTLQSVSIIKANEPTRNPTITRGS